MSTPDPAESAKLALIGGEMTSWSDRDDPDGRVPVYNAALARLTASVARTGARVLLAGPHHPRVMDRLLAGNAKVTWLLRSLSDATALASTYRSNPAVNILCGSLSKLDPQETFDAVVAFDGVDRLCSTEGVVYGWGEACDVLARTLRPGGRLLITVENHLGVHRLVRIPTGGEEPSDGVYSAPADNDDARPGSMAALTDRLAAAGLSVSRAYAAFPAPHAPTVLATHDRLGGDATLRGYVAAVVSDALAGHFAGEVVLRDPRQLAIRAIHSGLGLELAPAWLIVADHAPAADAEPLAEVMVSSGPGPERWEVGYEVVPDGADGWTRRLSPESRGTAHARDGVWRDPARLTGALPAGRPLDEILIDACARRDVPALRQRLTAYASWLSSHTEGGMLPGDHVFAVPGNVVVHGEGLAILDPSWTATEALPFPEALSRALRQIAVTLLTGGHARPWPDSLDADGLTIILTGLAGHDVDREVVQRAVQAEAKFTAAQREYTADRHDDLLTRLTAVDAGTPPVDVDSFSQLLEANRQLRRELEHATALSAWLEQLLNSREKALSRAQLKVDLLSDSISFRLGRAMILPARMAKRTVRRLRGRLRGLRGDE